MKNVMKMLLVSAALVVASPAWAAPGLAGSATPIEQGTIGLTSPSTPTQIAIALKAQPKYAAKDYSLAEIEAVLRSANGWNSNEVIPLNYRFSVPLPVETPVAKPEPVIVPVKEASAPATVVAPSAKVQPLVSPELTRLRAQQQANARELSALRSAVSARGANAPQAPGEAAKIASLVEKGNTLATSIKALETRLTQTEVVNTAQSKHLDAHDSHLGRLDGQVASAQSTANAALAAAREAAAEKAGWTLWDLGFAVMLFLVLIVAIAAYRRKPEKADVRDVVDEVLKDEGLSHTVLRAEIDQLRERVGANEERIESVGQQAGTLDIRFGPGQQEELNALPEGETLVADVHVELVKKLEIRFKRIENGLFLADEPKSKFRTHDPKVPIKNPLGFVSRNYGKGEFAGFMLSVVEETAAA